SGVVGFWAYRNYFGWRPIVIHKTHWLDGSLVDNENRRHLVIQYEVWNRHKYPISVRRIVMKFDQSNLEVVVCGFRRKSATDSGLKPATDSDLKSATRSDGSRPPIPI